MIALQDRPELVRWLARGEQRKVNDAPVQAFINQLQRELDAVSGVPPTVDVQAAENLPAYSVVTATGFNADSSNTAHYGKVAGITTVSVGSGFVASLATDQEVTNAGWAWAAGAQLFLNGTSISQTPPATGFSQMVGIAKNPTTMIVQIQIPILF